MDATILSTAEVPTPVRLRILADTFERVLGKSDYCDVMLKAADELEKAQLHRDNLLHAAKDFVAKCDRGAARSKDSYAKFKAAINPPVTTQPKEQPL